MSRGIFPGGLKDRVGGGSCLGGGCPTFTRVLDAFSGEVPGRVLSKGIRLLGTG